MTSTPFAQRSGRRVTLTIHYALHEHLIQSSMEQGRSLSNLCAYLIERSAESLLGFGPSRPE